MKFVFLVILATIISFFVWNILRRLFQSNIPRQDIRQNSSAQRNAEKIDRKVKWDAETVDYEEVKEEQKDQK